MFGAGGKLIPDEIDGRDVMLTRVREALIRSTFECL